MAANLSDLAAMGATPRLALLSLALPATLPGRRPRGALDGLLALAAHHGVHLVGGNVTRSPGPLVIDITAVGSVRRRHGPHPPGRAARRRRLGERHDWRGRRRPRDAGRGRRRRPPGRRPPSAPARTSPRSPASAWACCSAATVPPRRASISATASPTASLSWRPRRASALEIDARRDARRPCRRAVGSAAPAPTRCASAMRGGDDYELLFTVSRPAAVPLRSGPAPDSRRAGHEASAGSRPTAAPGSSRGESPHAGRRRLRALPMIRVTKAAVRKWTALLLHTHDTPRRTAAAFAVGVFFGFSPLLGLHTILAIIVAFVLGLNRVAVVAGVYSNLPWIIAPYYTLATIARRPGAGRVGAGAPGQTPRRAVRTVVLQATRSGRACGTLLEPMLWPYVVGSTLSALVLAGGRLLRSPCRRLSRDDATCICRIATRTSRRRPDAAIVVAQARRDRRDRPVVRPALPGADVRFALRRAQRRPARDRRAAVAGRRSCGSPPRRTARATSRPPASRRGPAWPPRTRRCCPSARSSSCRPNRATPASTRSWTPAPRSRAASSTSTCGTATRRCASAGAPWTCVVLRMGWDPTASPLSLRDAFLNRARPPKRDNLPSKSLPIASDAPPK